jgi:hypothetical protein
MTDHVSLGGRIHAAEVTSNLLHAAFIDNNETEDIDDCLIEIGNRLYKDFRVAAAFVSWGARQWDGLHDATNPTAALWY